MFARYAPGLVAALLLIAPALAYADTPIGATVIFVQGKAEAIPKTDNTRKPLVLGDTVAAGDTIVTGRDGAVEIRFDNNDQIRIDQSTRLVVQSLHRDDRGSTFSVFGLMFGRVKSAVNKLFSNDSRFEYQTKAAVAGVAGTPPWVVSYDIETETAEIDLIGDPGEEGAIFVQAFDEKRSRLTIPSGQRTVVRPGGSPQRPFFIDPSRLQRLRRDLKFNTPPLPKPNKPKVDTVPTSPLEEILKTQAAHTVSVPSKLAPTSEKNAGDFNAGTSSQQGTVGELGGDTSGTTPATYRIEVNFR